MSDFGGLGIVIEENEDNKRHIDHELPKLKLQQQQIIQSNSIVSSPLPTPNSQQSFHQPKLSMSSKHSSNASLSSISHKSSSQSLNHPITTNQQILPQQTSPKLNLHIQSQQQQSQPISQQIINDNKIEMLLPPLPDAPEDLRSPLISNYNSNIHDDQNSTSSITSNDNQQPSNHDDTSTSQSVYSNEFNQIYQNNKSSFSNYALDFPTIEEQQHNQSSSNLSYFPTLKSSNQTSTVNLHDSLSSIPLNNSSSSVPQLSSLTTNLNQTNSSDSSTTTEKTSPLKKLKSLKNGIRKLSLGSNNNSNSNISTPITPKFPNLASTNSVTKSFTLRPTLTPLQFDNDNKSSNLTIATPTPIPQPNTSNTNHQHHHSSSSSASTSSSLTSILRAKRVRASSQGNFNNNNNNINPVFTPITPPPMVSPIITISENLQSSKTTMNNMEQNYFESLATQTNSTISSTTLTSSPNTKTIQPITSIEEMKNINDLINYFHFLYNQKQSISKIFEKTKEKLNKSGWCSTTDLNNLQLQQDSQNCQIDSTIAKIEEKLNRDFNYSIINQNNYFTDDDNENEREDDDEEVEDYDIKDEFKNTISPSLKVLESRCFSFNDI
ncbi:uncharacterized protein KGF55_002662 [Candida pseudojiufengensis]|uniref:uncharacterized protein n=1 Tax=Candida pseudojiufengensis TaxID=497109 RepID=UPI0022245F2C|nr:uncharacterized protein KGF55_002662 [Candida pseudojiufengensis]KAI5963782.1 hypothetical protein KGF55_002662 [Candida pseudojiufengensis]